MSLQNQTLTMKISWFVVFTVLNEDKVMGSFKQNMSKIFSHALL